MNNSYKRLLDLVVNEEYPTRNGTNKSGRRRKPSTVSTSMGTRHIAPIKPSEYKDKQAREEDRKWSPKWKSWEAARKEAARKSKE